MKLAGNQKNTWLEITNIQAAYFLIQAAAPAK